MPPVTPPPPSPPPLTGIFVWLGNLNNLLTTVGACVAALAAILTHLNKTRIEALDAEIKKLDVREKLQKSSKDFADIFNTMLTSDTELNKNEKILHAKLSVLNIVADASGSKDGESDPHTRAFTPLNLALILGEPGAVAAMDVKYDFLDDWIAVACADNNERTRTTAIQALVGVCEKALHQGRLDIVVRCIEAINELFDLLPAEIKDDDSTKNVRNKANAARLQLAAFFKRQEKLISKATIPPDVGKPHPSKETHEATLRSYVKGAFEDVASDLQDTAQNLKAKLEKLKQGTEGVVDAQKTSEVKATLAQINAALTSATQSAVDNATSTQPQGSGSTSVTEGTSKAVETLLGNLKNADNSTRRKARSELALFAQSAVKPLLKELEEHYYANYEPDYKARLGVASTLRLMRQPIALDRDDAYWVVSLLRSNDAETRNAASDFLMDLENDKALRNCFDAIEMVFWELCKTTDKNEKDTIMNIAIIMGTWARVITSDTDSRELGKSFPKLALETVKLWKKELNIAAWPNVQATLDELIKRIESASKKSQPPLPDSNNLNQNKPLNPKS